MDYKIIGQTRQIRAIVESIKEISSSSVPVLITGEKGTGRELTARAIHHNGRNYNKRFIVMHCASVSHKLIELAIRRCHGTIFLSEVGELELAVQVQVLRLLKEKEFEQSQESYKSTCRLIASTSHDLGKEISAGHFREELLYMLNTVQLDIPPLRSRKYDIPFLVEEFLHAFCRREKKLLQISNKALKILMNYQWPGNVRELKNVIERAVILAKDNVITPKELPLFIFSAKSLPLGTEIAGSSTQGSLEDVAKKALQCAERQYIIEVLRETGGNKTKAAKKLKVCYKTLFNKIKEYDIESF